MRSLPRRRSPVVGATAAEQERRVGWAIVVLVNAALALVGVGLALASRPSPPSIEAVTVPPDPDTLEAVGLDPWRPGECFCR